MSEEAAFEKSLSMLSQFFVGDRTIVETLDRVAELATEAIPTAEFVGITMIANGRVQTAVFTDAESPEIDQAQYDAGIGPCLDAFHNGDIHLITSTREDELWPAFSEACTDHEILSTLSLPLTVNGETSGAMNLYSRTENGFDPYAVQTARLFAAQAALVLANAREYWSARSRAEQLDQALHGRAPIEQAKGIIMATMRCDPDQAFAILVKQSQQQNRKLHDIAKEIVANAFQRP